MTTRRESTPFAACPNVRRGTPACSFLRVIASCLCVFAASLATIADAAISPQARAALINFYNSTNGPNWTLHAGWNGAAGTECSWYGITCDPGQTQITEIQLNTNNLIGNVVPTFSAGDDFGSLQILDLSENPGLASAPVPDFSALPQLQMLFLRDDGLSGAFPDLSALANLQLVFLDGNAFKGQITSIVNLPKLAMFNAASNHLTGPLPDIGTLPNLTVFDVHANHFAGQIPKPPAGIAYLDVSDNQLSGTLPPLVTLQALDVLNVEQNQLVGPVPTLPASITQFKIAANRFFGSIPAAVNTLASGDSSLCPNQLFTQADPAWDQATGHSPWYGSDCGADPYGHLTLEKDLIKVRPSQATNLLASGAGSLAANDLIAAPTSSLTQLSPLIHGSLDLKNPEGTFKYRDSDGIDDFFLYWHCDSFLDCAGAEVEIFVDGNTAPIAAWDSAVVPKGGTAQALIGGATSVLANDRDDDGDTLFASVTKYPLAGSVRLNADGTFVYQNIKQNAMVDTFDYVACDKWSQCASATVTILIGTPPPPNVTSPILAVDDEIEVLPNGSTSALVGGADKVLANDVDFDGNTLFAKKLTDPVNGDLQLDITGTFTYTNTYPSATSDSFAYQACDAYSVCAVGVVKVDITNNIAVDQAPAAQDDVVDVLPGGTTSVLSDGATSLLFNDTDPEGDPMQVFMQTNALHGAASILDHVAGTFTYTNTAPANDDSFKVEVCDSHGACSISTVLVHIMHKPSVTKSFSPSSVTLGGTALMTLALGNPNSDAVVGVDIDDLYPNGMLNAPGNPIVIDTCNFQQKDVQPNGISATLAKGSVAAGGACSIVIKVIGTAPVNVLNDTGPVPSDNAETGDGDTATLTVSQGPTLTAPTVEKTFDPATVPPGGSSKMTIKLTNPNANNAILGVQLDDTYPAPLGSIINAPGSVVDSDDCGFTEDVPAGGDWTKLHDGTIAAGGACSIVVNVIGQSTATNVTGAVSSLNAQTVSGASATLTVNGNPLLPAPTAGKQFSPLVVTTGGTAEMTITLTNNAGAAITGVNLSDVYPPGGMVNGSGNPVVSDTCNFNEDVQASGPSAVLTGGTIPAGVGSTCSIVIDVVGTSSGFWTNQTSTVTSDNATVGAGGQANLQVVDSFVKLQAPVVTQSFVPSSILVGGTAKLKISLTNPQANTLAITGAALTDAYGPAPAHIANIAGASTDCGGALQAAAGDTLVSLAGGVVPADGSCSILVDVIGLSPGSSTGSTSVITSNNADPATASPATLTVGNAALLSPPLVGKSFDPPGIPAGATSKMTITLGNPNGAPITGAQIDDDYPDGMLNAPGNPVQSDSCGFNEDVPPGGAWTHLYGGTIPPGGCSIVIDVVGTATATNQTGPLLSGNAQSGAGASAVLTVQGGGGGMTPQQITFTSTAPADATVLGATYQATATATSGLPVALTIDAASATVCTIDGNGIVSFIGPGSCTVDANQPGGTNLGIDYAPAPQAQQSFAVASAGGQTPQTITFTSAAPDNAVVNGQAYQPTATAPGGAVVMTVDGASATVCAIDGSGTVSFIGPGMCTIDANQGGNDAYAPAPQAQQSFAVAPAGGQMPQTITFTSTPPDPVTVAGPDYLVSATADSQEPVVLTIDGTSATVCTIANHVVHFIGAGICTIDANQGGDADYAPAPQKQQAFPVVAAGGQTSQAITFVSVQPADATVGGPSYLAIANATSSLPVVLTIDATAASVCTINNGTVSFIGIGTCTIDADQGGNQDYAPAPQVQQAFAVAPPVDDVIFRDGFDNP